MGQQCDSAPAVHVSRVGVFGCCCCCCCVWVGWGGVGWGGVGGLDKLELVSWQSASQPVLCGLSWSVPYMHASELFVCVRCWSACRGPRLLRVELDVDLKCPAKLALTCWAHADFVIVSTAHPRPLPPLAPPAPPPLPAAAEQHAAAAVAAAFVAAAAAQAPQQQP